LGLQRFAFPGGNLRLGGQNVHRGRNADLDLNFILLEQILGQLQRFLFDFEVLMGIDQIPIRFFGLIYQIDHLLFQCENRHGAVVHGDANVPSGAAVAEIFQQRLRQVKSQCGIVTGIIAAVAGIGRKAVVAQGHVKAAAQWEVLRNAQGQTGGFSGFNVGAGEGAGTGAVVLSAIEINSKDRNKNRRAFAPHGPGNFRIGHFYLQVKVVF